MGRRFRRQCFVGLIGALLALDPHGRISVAAMQSLAASVRYPTVAFVVSCQFSHRSSDDPIVHHGNPGASHEHDFFGNTSTNAASTARSLSRGSTTCNESADRAAYWLPTLKGGAWNTNMRAYYSAGSVSPSSILVYPRGLQLIAGPPMTTDVPRVEVVAFSCGRGVDDPGWTTTPSVCNGPTTARLTFPQCWDGKHLNAPGNAVSAVAGRCSSAYPVALPLLRLVVSTKARVEPSTFTTSAGAVNRLHADFFNAWEPAGIDRLIAVCIRGERASNRDVKRCRGVGTGPRAAGGPDKDETNF